ncbi:DUF4019 domain-containing protein [uncultured Pseudoteredinibacter sp.]|uniref:DUF4019 domain-containing protein n=1 Tax=uncultured Pseudoteredinibacter sp. TaxID=1641701 RepID=UPI0026361EE5|nr:DUF4019 domain-containing protein [uncultured Pseudoteredinibacter sp.]
MKLFIKAVIIFGLYSGLSIAQGLQSKEVISWLEMVDSGQYAQSWDAAAPYFKSQVAKDDWQKGLTQVRKPLGKVLNRQISNSDIRSSLPGAPVGEYIVVTLSASFEKMSRATETVTLKKEGDNWQVVGYYIK